MTDSTPASTSRETGNLKTAAASACLPGLGEALLGYPVRGAAFLAVAFSALGATVVLLVALGAAALAGEAERVYRTFLTLVLLASAVAIFTAFSVRFAYRAAPRPERGGGCAVSLSLAAGLLVAMILLGLGFYL